VRHQLIEHDKQFVEAVKMAVNQCLQGSDELLDQMLSPTRTMQISCKNTLRIETRPVSKDIEPSYGEPSQARLYVFVRKAGQGIDLEPASAADLSKMKIEVSDAKGGRAVLAEQVGANAYRVGGSKREHCVDVTIDAASMFDSRLVVLSVHPLVPDPSFKFEKAAPAAAGSSDLLNDLGLGGDTEADTGNADAGLLADLGLADEPAEPEPEPEPATAQAPAVVKAEDEEGDQGPKTPEPDDAESEAEVKEEPADEPADEPTGAATPDDFYGAADAESTDAPTTAEAEVKDATSSEPEPVSAMEVEEEAPKTPDEDAPRTPDAEDEEAPKTPEPDE